MSDFFLPCDVTTIILNRVSDCRDLVRCRRVSKEWLTLIDSPEFIQSRLQRSDQSLRRLLIQTNSQLFYLSPTEGENKPLSQQQRLSGSKVLGTCDGLVCTWFNLDGTLQILNPTTGERISFPAASPHPREKPGITPFWYGFGYDRLSNDYKAVRILSAPIHRVEIYSVRKMSYRFITSRFRYYGIRRSGVVARGGKLHWITGYTFTLLVFDLGRETLESLLLPDFGDRSGIDISLGTDREGRLCVSALHKGLQRVDLWVMMTENWTEDCWSKVCRVEFGSIQGNHVSSITMVGTGGGGSRILFLLNRCRLFWYDPLTGHGVEAVEMNGIIQGGGGGGDAEFRAFYSLQSLAKILP